ncbi:GNAT family N-acetyltransferase [Gallaecimonas sp. GXIMD4217]|uniref:GNAT family N-acetyltransferase n=1 Tax=Gallaecimonas sp. GXIMD4217 TaxID=3131927 RepID=UPI00311B3B1A
MTIIRKASRDDAQAAWDIRNAAIRVACPAHYDAEVLALWTEGDMTDDFITMVAEHFQVAELHGRVMATGMICLDTGKVDAIFVHPRAMGSGLGLAMMAHLEALARRAGLNRLFLEATLNAAPFYRRCGFVGDRVDQYHSPRGITLPCVPMAKPLPRG